MSRIVAYAMIVLAASFGREAFAQSSILESDSSRYAPSADSARRLDSAYLARKAMLDRWVREQKRYARPQSDFISVYAGYGGYLQILPRDLNQVFSERSLRPDPASDRNQFGTVDRAFVLSGQAQLAETWGIYFEYDLTMEWFNTVVDANNATEELDLTEHGLVVGGMYVIYNGPWFRLRAEGAMGGVVALTNETETPGNYARSASAAGYQVNFDLLNDFRVMQNMSFTIDLLTRTITTGELKTSGGQALDTPFGAYKTTITLAPTASNLLYGFAAGLVYYF